LNSLGWQPQVWANPIRRAPEGRPTAEVRPALRGLQNYLPANPGLKPHHYTQLVLYKGVQICFPSS